jgi:AcrR family transcriptional regulator
MKNRSRFFTIEPVSPLAGKSRHGSRPGRRQVESEQRRQRILEAARECFGQRGFAGATIEAIAATAGVSNGLLYQFFRNKEHLFEVVVEELIRDWARALRPPAQGTASQKLEAMFRGAVAFCRTNPLLPALLTRDEGLQLQRFRNISADRVSPFRDLVSGILREGIEAGELRADLDVPRVADIVCQLQSEYASRAYLKDPLFPSDSELIDSVVRFIRDALVR